MQIADQPPLSPAPEPVNFEERAALLSRVLGSTELHRSARSREFLEYIGNRVLAGATYISEQEIGVKVFGRSRDYDTAIDNIVRVNASHLRKRIEIYFATEGTGETLLLQLPRGSYLPVFEHRPAEPLPEPVVPQSSPVSAIEPELLPERKAATAPLPRSWKAALAALTALAALLTVTCLWLLMHPRGASAGAAAPGRANAGAFWSGFFSNGKPTDLVLADTSFALMQDMLGQPISLKQYTDRTYMSHIDGLTANESQKRDLRLLSGRTYGSFAEFRFAEQLLLLAPAGATLTLDSARDFSPAALSSHNVILVGSRRSNPWVDLYDDRLNYGLHSDINTGVIVVDNRHPQPGEPVQFTLASDPNDFSGFCLIASLSLGEGGNNLIIIQGTGSEETQAAGDFLRSPEALATLEHTLGRAVPHNFEVLLRTRKLPGAPLSMKIVSARAY